MPTSSPCPNPSAAACRSAALDYATRGLALLPLAPADKRPHHGVLNSVYGKTEWAPLRSRPASPAEITAWFDVEPQCNVGVITGPASGGLAVVETDGPMPGLRFPETTPIVRARRGFHVWVHAPDGTASICVDGVGELRAGGLYVVVPPSVHPSGVRYRWINDLDYAEPVDLARILAPELGLPRPPEDQDDERREHQDEDRNQERTSWSCAPLQDVRERWITVRQHPSLMAQVLGVLGIDAPPGRNFRCVLPGHQEQRPSARVWDGMYFDFHRRDGDRHFRLSEVFASQCCGRVIRLPAASRVLWRARLLHAADLLDVDVRPLALPGTANEIVRKVAAGFALNHALAVAVHGNDAAQTFTRRYAATWCGVTEKQAELAIGVLIHNGAIRATDRCVVYGKTINRYEPGRPA